MARAFSRALFKAGSNIPANTAMIAIIMRSSIKVKVYFPRLALTTVKMEIRVKKIFFNGYLPFFSEY